MTPQRRPWWIAAALALWGGVWLWQGLRLPQFDQYAGIGPGLVVTIIGAVLLLLAAILAWEIRAGVRFEEQAAEDIAEGQGVSNRALALAAVACGLPILTMQSLGFVVTGALCFALVARAFRSVRPLLDLTIGAVLAGLCYLGFGFLGVKLGGLLPILGV